jgi:hypothetical protein
LKADYKKVKDYNGETGKNRNTCKSFEKLDAILGHRPASAPGILLLDAGSPSTAVDEPTSQEMEMVCCKFMIIMLDALINAHSNAV